MQAIYYTLIIYLLFFAMIYSYFNEKNSGAIKNNKKGDMSFFVILAAALLFRIIFSNAIEGHKTDIACFKQWAEHIAKVGTQSFYSPEYFADYPPLYMLVLYIIGLMEKLFKLTYNSPIFTTLIKFPAMLADVVLVGIIYYEGKVRIGKNAATAFALLIAFSPAIIINSTFWGQIDSLFALFLVASLICLYKEKFYLAAFLYIVCALIKPQAFIIAPVYLCAYFATKDWKMIGKSILIAIATTIITTLPFTNNFNFMWLVEKYQKTLASYPYATVNAYNLYALFGYNWKPLTAKFMFLPVSFWSTAVILLTTIGSIYFYIKAKDKSKLFYMGYLIITTIFTLGAKMHERYLFPALILLAFTYIYKKDKRLLFLFIAQTATHYLNVANVLVSDMKGVSQGETFNSFIFIVSLINIALLIYSIVLAYRIFICEKTVQVQKKKKEIVEKEFIPFGKMVRLDYLVMAIITLIYGIVAFANLGDTKAPQTFYRTATNGFVVDLGSKQEIGSVMMYIGIGEVGKKYIIRQSDDSINWSPYAEQVHNSTFVWVRANGEGAARYLRFTSEVNNLMLGEIGVMDRQGEQIVISSATEGTICDEQSVVPLKPSYMNGTYFDEIYHPRTAYEVTNKLPPYETTHPPLGKLIMSIGVMLFGMTPFGWRVMGTLAGVLMLPVFYMLCKKLFKKTGYAAIGTTIFAFDFMHFAQTRLGTVDSYAVLFIMLMYYFVIDYLTLDFNKEPLKKGLLPLALTGITFGIGVATKWICLYAALGLATILIIVWVRSFAESINKKGITDFAPKFWKTILWCVLFFIIIPAIIYFAAYLPQISYDLHGRTATKYVTQNQSYMLSYHEGVKDSHPFSSKWYEWQFMKRPLWMFIDGELKNNGMVSSISTFGNPAVWWVGILAFLACIYIGIRKRSNIALLIIIGYLSQLVPWMAISRILFIYHYFACVPFLVLAIVYCMKYLQERFNLSSKVLWGYCGVVVLLFIMFYPVISGVPAPIWYVKDYLTWFDTWVFVN